MSGRSRTKITYDAEKVVRPIYTGGDVRLDGQGHVLATCLGEDAILTDLRTGELLSHVEGVRYLVLYAEFELIRARRMGKP